MIVCLKSRVFFNLFLGMQLAIGAVRFSAKSALYGGQITAQAYEPVIAPQYEKSRLAADWYTVCFARSPDWLIPQTDMEFIMNKAVQIQRVRRMLDDIATFSSESHDEIAPLPLAKLNVKPHYLPSPQQIREECRRIREGWSPEVRQQRAGLVTADGNERHQPSALTNGAAHTRRLQAACAETT